MGHEQAHAHLDAHLHGLDSEAGAERRPPRAPLGGAEALAVFAGGVIGALVRSTIARRIALHPGDWPWASFSVNMAGAAVLGFAVARLQSRPAPSPRARAFIAAGVCGTLTTFSAMMLELLHMLDGGRVGLALAYAAASIAGGLLLVTVAGRLGAGPPPATVQTPA